MASLAKPSVFISYSHKDKRWLDRLLEFLEPLKRQGDITLWSDEDLAVGEDWREGVRAALHAAKAAVLLVSPAFLASKYIANNELPVLLKKASDQGLTIIPIIARQCLWAETTYKFPHPVAGPEELSLATLQAANSPREPLNKLKPHQQDELLLSVAQRLMELIPRNP
ncbi:MAG TPA: toll/interleukin-1 receptor domain-containing protein [Thermoanaerobaculia bacterium]|jgi:hypothetical protein|nr:toll/interleukin-1 receptor domain-containing protein [Thermoanaerobaculia bacterium]